MSTACKRCGKCCVTDLIAYVSAQDSERWKKEGREDILHILDNEKAVWAGDHLVSARDGRELQTCPFFIFEGNVGVCTIYETRPKICRDFPPSPSC